MYWFNPYKQRNGVYGGLCARLFHGSDQLPSKQWRLQEVTASSQNIVWRIPHKIVSLLYLIPVQIQKNKM